MSASKPTARSIRILVALGLLWSLAPREANGQLQKIKISYSAPSTSIAFQVAMAHGFYKEEGLDVELIQVNPRLAPIALANGDIDFTTTFNNTLQAIVQGFPLKFVFVSVRKGAFFLMARPELKSIQDLTNKKIGVTNLTSVDHVSAEEMLRNKGMNLSAVTFLGLGNEALRIQALRAGAVDAIAIAPPHHLQLMSLGFNPLAGPQDVQRARPLSGIAIATRLLKEKPQAIKQLNRALLKSHRFIFENKTKTAEVMTKWLHLSQEAAVGSYDLLLLTLSRNGEITDNEWETLSIKPKTAPDVRDFTLLHQAQKELGIK
ncbi:MAG: transporter substrate-binding domain-containing protein [Deltaproteobacteria bacterium]|nr:transporter substrate-binding domain-containing protein [Deltaproteobacteria bacterium]